MEADYYQNGRVYTLEVSPGSAPVARGIDGYRWHPELPGKPWSWPAGCRADVASLFGLSAGTLKAAEEYSEEHASRGRQASSIINGTHPYLEELKARYAFTLAHQREAAALAMERRRVCLWYSTGTGKTVALLMFCAELLRRPREVQILVLCPRVVIEMAWMTDAAEFFPDLPIVDQRALPKDKRRPRWNAVNVINYESLATTPALRNAHWDAIILDESVKIKTPTAKITTTLEAMYPAAWRICGSGYPAPLDERDYWSQIHWCQGDREEVVSPSYWGFVNKWFEPSSFFYKWRGRGKPRKKIATGYRLKPALETRFNAMLSQICYTKTREECLDLPDRLPNRILFADLPPKVLAAYNNIAADLLATADAVHDGLSMTPNIKNKMWALRQIACGFLRIDGEDTWLSDHKLKVLGELLEIIGKDRLIVWTSFREEFDQAKTYLDTAGETYAAFDGRSSAKEAAREAKRFKNDECRILIANQACGKYGLTFVNNCHNAVYLSLTHNYDNFAQSGDRIDRWGQTMHPRSWFIFGRLTHEPDMLEALLSKESVLAATCEAIRKVHKTKKPA